MNLNLQKQTNEDLIHGFIEGEIEVHTALLLKDELELIVMSDGLIIEMELSKVTYMDSSGLGVLVAFYKKVIKENTSLKLLNPPERITRMFNITGLSQFMDIEIRKNTSVGV